MKLSNKEIKDLLAGFFPKLKPNDMDLFLTLSSYKTSKNKALILKGGGTSKDVLLLLKGSARAYTISNAGEEQNNFIRYEGHLIADAKVFGDQTQILDVESIGKIHYLKFNIGELENIGLSNPGLMLFYLDFLKEIILTLSHRVNTFVSMNSKERYDDLLRWNPKYLETAFDKDIATFLGITPLTLHRIKNPKSKDIK